MNSSRKQSFLYFAYGSNMLSERLRQRTPSCRSVGIAELRQYRLRFHKKSIDGSAKCNAWHTRRPTDSIQGVLYRIDISERTALDAAEFLGLGYRRLQVVVGSSNSSHPVRAETYIALDSALNEELLPYDWYQALVVSGAQEHGIADEYVAAIADHPVAIDPDPIRRAYHFGLTRRLKSRPAPF